MGICYRNIEELPQFSTQANFKLLAVNMKRLNTQQYVSMGDQSMAQPNSDPMVPYEKKKNLNLIELGYLN